jgi:hypothetical protein
MGNGARRGGNATRRVGNVALQALRVAFPPYRITFPAGNEARSPLHEARRTGNAARSAVSEPLRHHNSLSGRPSLPPRAGSPVPSRNRPLEGGLDRPYSMLHTASVATPLTPRAHRGTPNGNSRAFGDCQIAGFFWRVNRSSGTASRTPGIRSRGGQQGSLTIDTPFCQGGGAPGPVLSGFFVPSAALQAASEWTFRLSPRAMPWAKLERPLRASSRSRAGNAIRRWSGRAPEESPAFPGRLSGPKARAGLAQPNGLGCDRPQSSLEP